MPQEFQILRCYSCEKFQVHQTKKATKWQCKVCGEKQSLKKAYFIGSAKDCRINVQQLNVKDGQRKVDSMLNASSEVEESNIIETEFENGDCTDSDTFENVGGSQLSQHKNSYDFDDPHFMPKKKQRYSEDSFPENIHRGALTQNSFNDENQEIQQGSPNIQTPCISFDVSFDNCLVENSDKTAHNLEMASKCFSLSVKNAPLFSEPVSSKKKLEKPQNRGFQLIMNAAKKLSVDIEHF